MGAREKYVLCILDQDGQRVRIKMHDPVCEEGRGESREGYPGLNPAAPTYRSSLPMGIAMPAPHNLQNKYRFSRLK